MKSLTFLLIALFPAVAALGWVTTPGSDVDTEYLADNYMPLNPHTFTNVLRIAGQPSPSASANLELRAGIHTGVGAYGDIVFRAGSIRAYNTNHLSVAGGFPHEGGVDAGHLILRGGQAYAGGANGIIKLGSRIDGQGHSVSNVTQIHADQFIATSQLSVDNIVLDRSGTAARFKNPLWAWGDIRAFGDYLRAGDQDFGTGQGKLWLRDSSNDGSGVMRFYDQAVEISWDGESTWAPIAAGEGRAHIQTIAESTVVTDPNWIIDLSNGPVQAFVIDTHITNTTFTGVLASEAGFLYGEIVRGTNSVAWSDVQWIREPSWAYTNTVIIFNVHRGAAVSASMQTEYNP